MSCYTCPSKLVAEPLVISGMSGRFPESDSVDEFAQNLYENKDLITDDNRRWPSGFFGFNSRMGKLKDVDRLDGTFFGILKQLGDTVDPHSRILLETTYEAIIDAGVNPQNLRGSDTGVYIGYSSFAMPDGLPEDVFPDSEDNVTQNMLGQTGQAKALYANRVSFVFDLKGPSLVVDTACSSSLVAFNTAMNDLRLGKCRQAIVGATQVCLQAFANHVFQATRVNASDGIPKVWDEKADGYVRGESVVCFLLQRRSDAKRIYATVLNSGVNIDGFKKMGMFFPSSESQEELMVQVYKEANVDPLKVNYFEAHGTGTQAGDTQEAKAIYNAYCRDLNREEPLHIGLLKSIIGHCEGASGAPAVVRVILAYERECLTSNLHLNTLKNGIKQFCPPLEPVQQNMRYTPGIAGVNNFGIGGVNGHVLLEPNYKTESENSLKIADTISRIVNICCRTEGAFHSMCKWIEDNPQRVSRDFLALLADTMRVKPSLNSSGMPYRGWLLIKQLSDNTSEYKKQFSVLTHKSQRPVWVVFPGLGGQWIGMAKALMPIKIFADKIEECHQILKPYGIDLKEPLLSDDPNSLSTITNKFCATTALEMALFDVMKALDIIPDGIIGHSFGEIAAAYSDGCLTTEEAILISYLRGSVVANDNRIPKGLMAAVGLSWTEAKKLCPKGVEVVCNNAKELVVVSGLEEVMIGFIDDLKTQGVFVRVVQSSGVPLHTQFMKSSAEKMTQEIKNVLPNPRLRSRKWVSTAVIDSDAKEELKYASAEYFVHNLINPVLFHNKLTQIPEEAIVIEVGPHPIFARAVKEVVVSGDYISLMKKDSNDTNLDLFLTSIGKLYELGLNPKIENLYPRVEWPVPRGTPSISSLMKWDHSETYFTRKYPDYCFRGTASDMNVTFNLGQSFKSWIPDHQVDGNILFPAVGHLMLAWRRMAAFYGKQWKDVPVVFENVQFRRPLFFSETDATRVKVRYFDKSGHFSVEESGNICCLGRIKTKDEYVLNAQHMCVEKDVMERNDWEVVMDANDVYKDLGILGFHYGPKFRRLKTIRSTDFETLYGETEWDGNWVTFIDSLLQSIGLGITSRKLMVPVMFESLRCDPKTLFEAIDANRVIETEKSQEIEDRIDLDNVTDEDLDKDWLAPDVQKFDLVEDRVKNDYRIYKSILRFRVDTYSRMIVTNGVEIEGMSGFPFPRKTNPTDLKLESYEFIANEDSMAIDMSERKSVLEYIKVCTSVVNKIQSKIGLKVTKYDVNVSEEVMNKYVNDIKEEHILLKLLNELSKRCVDENQNIDTNEILNNLFSKPEFDLSFDVINQVSKNERLIRSLIDIVSENYVPKKEIKVLEINSTKALVAEDVDNYLATYHIYPIIVDYTIAVQSLDSIPEEYKQKAFKTIEWKASDSSVFPSDAPTADLIVYKDSYDLWEIDVEKHLKGTYDSLSDRGFLLSVFRYQFTEPEMALNQMNSKRNLKNSDLKQRIADYVMTAEELGLRVIANKYDSIGSMSFLFRKVMVKQNIPKKENIIEFRSDSYEWFESLKEKLNQMKENEKKDIIWLLANDSSTNGIIGLINCLRLEPGGEAIRCLFDCDNSVKTPIDFNEKPFSNILCNDLAINVLKDGKLGTYRHLTLPKDYDKIETNEYFLNTGATRDLSGLQWFDMKNLVPLETSFLSEEKQIKCVVYMCGLNFRDVVLASGRVMPGNIALFTDCMIGSDFAGRRFDTGERVMGFVPSRSFATTVNTNESWVTPIPQHWTMEEAVTLLATYDTIWYGLIERAHLRNGDSILIHSGAGGVGQAAISVCQYYNCDIYVTVGTEEKKQFLIKKFNIPDNRIFSSRNIQFKYDIKRLTKGMGVDIVLNSLTGDLMDASFECVSDSGRFVEIGKYELQMNKQLDSIAFLRDISFIGVSIDKQLFFIKDSCKKFLNWIQENSTNGMIQPINTIVFRPEEMRNAFTHMTTGKHIGKIVIRIRDEENQKILKSGFSPSKPMSVMRKTYFNPNKVYIITGGLGGFGLELIHWMLFTGARKFVLTSRHGIKTDYQNFIIKRIGYMGKKFKYFETKFIVSTHDTTSIYGAKRVISDAQQLGPIGGVFHLAVALKDGLLVNQTIDDFLVTTDSKGKSFKNLDEITRNLNLDLDYFVAFSSVSCGKGNAGQSNYGYANSLCERICEARRRNGLHGLAIQWGPIGDVGILAETEFNATLAAIVKQRVHSCLEIMDKFLQTNKSIVSCVMRAKRTLVSGTKESKLVNQLWQALGIDPKTTNNHLTLGEIGIESMFAVELQQEMEREYDIKVTLNDIKNITIGMMKEFEAGKIEDMKKFADEIQDRRNKLSKIKFIIPSESNTRLNNVTTGDPIYFLPPLEGIFASMEGLAKRMDRPVIALNWIRDLDEFASIEEINEYYKQLMETLEPNGNYHIVGHLFGALIAMEMLNSAPVGKALIIDTLSETKMDDDLLSDDTLLDMILAFITHELPPVLKAKLKRDLQSKPDIPSKVAKIAEEVKEFVGKSLVSKDLEEILNSSFRRAKLFNTYRLNMKSKYNQFKQTIGQKWLEMTGRLLIIKPLDVNGIDSNEDLILKIKNTYYLTEEEFEGKVELETVDTTSAESNVNLDIFEVVSDKINEYFA